MVPRKPHLLLMPIYIPRACRFQDSESLSQVSRLHSTLVLRKSKPQTLPPQPPGPEPSSPRPRSLLSVPEHKRWWNCCRTSYWGLVVNKGIYSSGLI